MASDGKEKKVNPWAISASVATIVAVVIGAMALWMQVRKPTQLTFSLVETYTYIDWSRPSDITGLEVSYRGEKVKNLRLAIFDLKNTGGTVISTLRDTPAFNLLHDFAIELSPERETSDMRILSASLESASPAALKVNLKVEPPSRIATQFGFLNPGDSFRFSVLLAGTGPFIPRYDQRALIGGSIRYIDQTLKTAHFFLDTSTPFTRLACGALGLAFLALAVGLIAYVGKEAIEVAREKRWKAKWGKISEEKDKKKEEIAQREAAKRITEVFKGQDLSSLEKLMLPDPPLGEKSAKKIIEDHVAFHARFADETEKLVKQELSEFPEIPEQTITIHVFLSEFVAQSALYIVAALLSFVCAAHFGTMAF